MCYARYQVIRAMLQCNGCKVSVVLQVATQTTVAHTLVWAIPNEQKNHDSWGFCHESWFLMLRLGPTVMGSENRKQTRDFLHRTETREQCSPHVVMGRFCSLPTQEKTCFSHIARHCWHESSPHRIRVTTKLRACAPLKAEIPRCQFAGRRVS